MNQEINEKTRIPLSLVLTICLGVAWLVRLESRVNVDSKQIEDTASLQKKHLETVQSINTRLSRIEGKLRIVSTPRFRDKSKVVSIVPRLLCESHPRLCRHVGTPQSQNAND